MALQVGNIVDGTVVNVTNFGAFVEVEGKIGLVHISEVSSKYVKDVSEYVKKKDKVKVKILSINDDGKMSLSIKQVEENKKSCKPEEVDWGKETSRNHQGVNFEDKISKFLKESEERFQDIRKHQNARYGGGHNKKNASGN